MPTQRARDRALEVARAMIGGRTDLTRGCSELAALRPEVCSDSLSPTFLPILAAADDTRELRPPRSIHLTDAARSETLVRRTDALERLHREAVLDACRRLVAKLQSD